jgi:hypothetical protein
MWPDQPVEPMVANDGWVEKALSRPIAAEGGGRRPAFSVAARPAKFASRGDQRAAGIIRQAIVFDHISVQGVESLPDSTDADRRVEFASLHAPMAFHAGCSCVVAAALRFLSVDAAIEDRSIASKPAHKKFVRVPRGAQRGHVADYRHVLSSLPSALFAPRAQRFGRH